MPRSSAETRKRILDAAYRLFRRQGYSRVSMDEIAAATTVTKRTLYYPVSYTHLTLPTNREV